MVKRKPNPCCPVHGCNAKQPHTKDKQVSALMFLVEHPEQMASVVHDAIGELGNAACNELNSKHYLAFISRLRQVEELYVRTLYLLLLATPEEQPHIVSGAMPNGLSRYYEAVSPAIFTGQPNWKDVLPGLNGDEFTIMDTLNDGAHVSYFAVMMARGFQKNPAQVVSVDQYAQYIKSKMTKLKYMHGMFAARKSREDVLDGVTAMHKPASYWKTKQDELKHPTP